MTEAGERSVADRLLMLMFAAQEGIAAPEIACQVLGVSRDQLDAAREALRLNGMIHQDADEDHVVLPPPEMPEVVKNMLISTLDRDRTQWRLFFREITTEDKVEIGRWIADKDRDLTDATPYTIEVIRQLAGTAMMEMALRFTGNAEPCQDG